MTPEVGRTIRATVMMLVVCAGIVVGAAQGRGGQGRGSAGPAKAIAPVDLTGYWVSYINKDWRWRMVTPPKGDFISVPVNAAARKIGEAWDPAADEKAGEQCKSYGAAGVMRVPGRLHITWQDDETLKVETDAGTQTRLLRFGASRTPAGPPTWQGDSAAQWIVPVGGGTAAYGTLQTVTTRMRPGYLRRNGLPYSANTRMTEYWDLMKEPDGTDWLVIATTIEDPTYLATPWLTSPAFKREPDGTKWDPTPCSAQ